MKLLGNNCKQSRTTSSRRVATLNRPPRHYYRDRGIWPVESTAYCAIGGENDYFLSPLVIVALQHTVHVVKHLPLIKYVAVCLLDASCPWQLLDPKLFFYFIYFHYLWAYFLAKSGNRGTSLPPYSNACLVTSKIDLNS